MTKSDQYIVITPMEDSASVEQISGTELQERLNSGWYAGDKFVDRIPEQGNNTAYWPEGTVIILRALFVIPKSTSCRGV